MTVNFSVVTTGACAITTAFLHFIATGHDSPMYVCTAYNVR